LSRPRIRSSQQVKSRFEWRLYSSLNSATTHNGYIDAFPSVQAQYRFGSDTILRAAYGMGIARPNFGDIAPYFVDDPTSNPEFSQGNPNLKPTHAQNFDLVAEHYFKPLGMIQGGVFYKALTEPHFRCHRALPDKDRSYLDQWTERPHYGLRGGLATASVVLSRLLNGMGVRANYSYTTSRAGFPVDFGRTDHPTLLRTAPNKLELRRDL